MIARIDFQSGVPVYLQIVQQVKVAAATGLIRPGDPLPSVRALAEDLRINRNTVARAYAELESESVIETRQGSEMPIDPPSIESVSTLLTDTQTTLVREVKTTNHDAPMCMQCGVTMQRAGSCHACPSCGTTSGCS